jgi:hypothetical protein
VVGAALEYTRLGAASARGDSRFLGVAVVIATMIVAVIVSVIIATRIVTGVVSVIIATRIVTGVVSVIIAMIVKIHRRIHAHAFLGAW